MSKYSDDDDVIEVMESSINSRMKTEAPRSIDIKDEQYRHRSSSPVRNRSRDRSPRRSSPNYRRQNTHERQTPRASGDFSSDRQLEEGERRSRSSERRIDSMHDSARKRKDIKEETRDDRADRNDSERASKRRRNSSSPNHQRARDRSHTEVPMSLSWNSVEKVRNKDGEKVCPSGMPRLNNNYLDYLDDYKEAKAERKANRAANIKVEDNQLSQDRPKPLAVSFETLKKDFTDVKKWLEERPSRPTTYKDDRGRERSLIIAVSRWPERDHNEAEGELLQQEKICSKGTGKNTLKEKMRWINRYKYEAVYVCDKEKLEEEIEMRRNGGRSGNSNREALGRDRNPPARNPNMEAIGERQRTDTRSPRANLLPPQATERTPRESSRQSQRSPARDAADSRSSKRESVDRRYVEGQNGRTNGNREGREQIRPERDSHDRYSRSGLENETRQERSPRDNGGGYSHRSKSPNARSPEFNRSSRGQAGKDTYQERQPERRREYDDSDRSRTIDRARSPPKPRGGPRTPPPPSFSVRSGNPADPRSRHEDRSRRNSPPRDSYSSSLRDYEQMRMQEKFSPRDTETSSLQNARPTQRRDSFNDKERSSRSSQYDYNDRR